MKHFRVSIQYCTTEHELTESTCWYKTVEFVKNECLEDPTLASFIQVAPVVGSKPQTFNLTLTHRPVMNVWAKSWTKAIGKFIVSSNIPDDVELHFEDFSVTEILEAKRTGTEPENFPEYTALDLAL